MCMCMCACVCVIVYTSIYLEDGGGSGELVLPLFEFDISGVGLLESSGCDIGVSVA